MAQAGQGIGPFGYYPDDLQVQLSSKQNNFGQPAILDTRDSETLDAFFNNPDNPGSSTALFGGFSFDGMSGKIDMGKFGSGFQPVPPTTSPAVAMAGAQNGTYQNRSPNRRRMQPVHTENFWAPNNEGNHENTDVMNGARALEDMAAGQDHSQSSSNPMSPDGSAAASWGSMFTMTPSLGYASGSHYLPHHSSIPQLAPGHQNQAQHVSDWEYQNMLKQQQSRYQHQLSNGYSHGGPASHDMNAALPNPFAFISDNPPSISTFGQPESKPQLLHYGSDPNIRPNGYIAPSYPQYVNGKDDTLINVSMAQQAASKGDHMHSQQTAQMSQQNQRTYHRSSMPNGSRNYNTSSSSSRDIAGLPMAGPLAGSHLQVQPQYADSNSRVTEADDDDELQEQNPRKRRRSQMDCEEEADYIPGHRTGQIPKRGPKVPKAVDDEYDNFTTPNNSTKRRKSAVGGAVSASQDPDSPASPLDEASPSGDTSSSRKRAAAAAAKARQNLSESEKRQNHILSEQRRRNVIKNGYAELDHIVPVLNAGKSGLSKADALKEAINYLENCITGNELMMEQLGLEDNNTSYNGAAGGIEGY